MANESAWNLGSEIAQKRTTAKRDRQLVLEDEDRKLRVTDLYTKGAALAKVIPSLDGDRREQAMKSLTDIEQNIEAAYHPDHNPGALQRDWHWLADMVTKKKPAAAAITSANYDPTVTPDLTLTPGAQSIQLSAAPAYQTTTAGRNPVTGNLHTIKTTEPGVPQADVRIPSEQITIPGRTVDVRPAPAAMTPQQRRQMTQHDEARKQAELDVASAGLTPEEEVAVASRKNLAYITQARKDFKALNPDATPAQETAFMSDVIQKQYGTTQKAVYKEFIGPNGLSDWLDVTQIIPPGYTAVRTETADTRKRQDFKDYLKLHPDYSGSEEQWLAEQPQRAKLAVPTSRDDRYIAIEQKRKLGQHLTADEQAYTDAYDIYVAKRVTGPMLQRAAAQAGDRYVPFVDPSNPEQVVMMPVSVGAAAHLGTPQSIAFQTDKVMTKYMTVGKGGENINYFNTATEHLKLLNEAADALNNGDIQKLNQLGNAFATATGDPAPTNFETVKAAVSGELSKTFAGKSATVEEIAQINQAIYAAESPAQLHGAINQALSLMQGKLLGMRKQWESGKTGIPAFPDVGGGSKTGGAGDMIMMKLPPDATHPNGRTGRIHRLQKDQFVHDHPGAVEVTQ